tara:strand:+ start:11855 stop:12409 length:555 start_codon:yes stop_codon:yes gene_type:complete
MKEKTITAIYLFLVAGIFMAHSQERLVTKTGQINFEASVASFEEVKASNENVSAILRIDTGEFASLVLMKGFRFKVALMEEHFNENYVESSKYPKATFKGVLKEFDFAEITKETKEYIISGTINIHGIDKTIEVPVYLKKVGDYIDMSLKFALNPEDFNIKIPQVVSNKIADEINVSASYKLKG